jgi:phosphohistidine phosphatase
MELYFLRHASPSDSAASDAARELTNEGREEALVAGKALARMGVKPVRIFSSPLVRARQTAQIVANELKVEAEAIDELLNENSTFQLLKFLKTTGDAAEILLVGHMPSLAGHISHLIGARTGEGLAFGNGSVALVEIDELSLGCGRLRFILHQNKLREITS